MRILILGKPRIGKTSVSTLLSAVDKLDLVHINVENWVKNLVKKVKEYEPPEMEEED